MIEPPVRTDQLTIRFIDFKITISGLINPNAKSPKSKASQTILGLLNPQQKQARRTTLDTTWMTNTSPNKALVVIYQV